MTLSVSIKRHAPKNAICIQDEKRMLLQFYLKEIEIGKPDQNMQNSRKKEQVRLR